LTALHGLESLFPGLESPPLPLANRLSQERLLQLLLEARHAVMDRRQVVQETQVPHQAVLCLTCPSSEAVPRAADRWNHSVSATVSCASCL